MPLRTAGRGRTNGIIRTDKFCMELMLIRQGPTCTTRTKRSRTNGKPPVCTPVRTTHTVRAAQQHPAAHTEVTYMHSTACACTPKYNEPSHTHAATCAHGKTGINSAQHTNYDTSQKLNSRTTIPQSCIQQTNITHNYSNCPETNIAESVWAFSLIRNSNSVT